MKEVQILMDFRSAINTDGKLENSLLNSDGYCKSNLNSTILFWIHNTSDWIFVKSEVIVQIKDLLNEAGIEIPYPHLDVKIKNKYNNPQK